MVDRFPATIIIGGVLLEKDIDEFCRYVASNDMVNESNTFIIPSNAQDLMNEIDEHGTVTLHCADAAFGCFQDFELWLRNRNFSYDRLSEGCGEFTAVRESFRPEHGMVTCPTDADGNDIMGVDVVRDALDDLKAGRIKEGIEVLEEHLPDDLPDLPPFNIKE